MDRFFVKTGDKSGGSPEAVAGLDVPLGLELFCGNRRLYLEMLGKFVEGHRDAAAVIRRALAADEWGVAELVAHNTKGVSGCIGATTLQGAAAALEQAIGKQTFELDILLHRFDEALSEVISDLEAKLPLEQEPRQAAL